MTVFPVIIDSRPAYLGDGDIPTSLLLAPLGVGTLLGDLCPAVTSATGETLTVLSTFEPSQEYVRAIRDADLAVDSVLSVSDFAGMLGNLEPSDWLLLVDPRSFSLNGFDLDALMTATANPGWAAHLVALDTSSEGTKEYVQLDGDGRVRRIQRFYEGVTWLQASGVLCSLVPVTSPIAKVDFSTTPLTEFRKSLASIGVPGQDVPLQGESIDLSREAGLLRLAERRILETTAGPMPPGYKAITDDVYVGPNCTIDPTARLYGPVLIQAGAKIEPNATVIGPSIVGAGARVRRDSIVAQSLVMHRAVVGPEATFRHCVVNQESQEAAKTSRPDHRVPYAVFQPAASTIRQTSKAGSSSGEDPDRYVYPALKRVIEAIFTLLGLAVLSPVLLLTVLAIKLTSRGPILYGSKREGKNGVVFRCWKFRTMIDGAHSQQRALYAENKVDGPQFKMDRDPRVTWLGNLLRRGNIDELPQLINVVLGHMSLIGPRPSPFRENQICIPWRRARLSVRPGITGLWQICRHERSVGDFHQWIYYDILYVRHMSLWLDVKILLSTLITLGARRSVPLSWMIAAHKRHDSNEELSIPMREPILHRIQDQDAEWRDSSVSHIA